MMPARDLKNAGGAITYPDETICANIYAPSGRQRITLAGLISTRTATMLAPIFKPPHALHRNAASGHHSQLPDDQICRPCSNSSRHASLKLSSISTLPLL